jgi:hypothetical protein
LHDETDDAPESEDCTQAYRKGVRRNVRSKRCAPEKKHNSHYQEEQGKNRHTPLG